MLSEEQKKLRRTGIGSSDAPVILGESSFLTPFDVYLSKVEEFDPPTQPWQELGELLEPVALELYRRRTGAVVTAGKTTHRHPTRPVLLDTPDGVAVHPGDEVRLLEAKAIRFMDRTWGDDGTDEVEPAYVIQCQHHMLVARANGLNVEACDLPVLFAGSEFRIYTVRFDAELAEGIADECERWWREHVEARVAPPLDGSRNAGAWLAKRFPENRAPILEGTPEDADRAALLRSWEQSRDEAVEAIATLKNRFKERIGEADGVQGPWGRITWRARKDGVRVFKPTWFEQDESEAAA